MESTENGETRGRFGRWRQKYNSTTTKPPHRDAWTVEDEEFENSRDAKHLKTVLHTVPFEKIRGLFAEMVEKSGVFRANEENPFNITVIKANRGGAYRGGNEIEINPNRLARELARAMQTKTKTRIGRFFRRSRILFEKTFFELPVGKRWKEAPEFRTLIIYVLFHELCHAHSSHEQGYGPRRKPLNEAATDLAALILTARFLRTEGANVHSSIQLLIRLSPYDLYCYALILLGNEVTRISKTDPDVGLNGVIRGFFNEGFKAFDTPEMRESGIFEKVFKLNKIDIPKTGEWSKLPGRIFAYLDQEGLEPPTQTSSAREQSARVREARNTVLTYVEDAAERTAWISRPPPLRKENQRGG